MNKINYNGDKIYYSIPLTELEIAMILKLRQYEFGQFTIHKMSGEPRRVIVGGSEMLSETDAIRYLRSIKIPIIIKKDATTKSTTDESTDQTDES